MPRAEASRRLARADLRKQAPTCGLHEVEHLLEASSPAVVGVGHIQLTWMRWFAGSSVPGFLTLAIVPWLLCRMVKPELADMGPAREHAHVELRKMGPPRREEKWLVGILLAVMAAATTHIGLIATASTTYNSPYNLARRFASLDHVSGGRAGWNIVTTADRDSAANFGLEDRPATFRRHLYDSCETSGLGKFLHQEYNTNANA